MAKTANRFRAYETITVERPKADEAGKVLKDANGEAVLVETDASGDVFMFGDSVPASGIVKFNSGSTKIRRVAFYAGPVDEEVCLGSVEVNASGAITASVADIPRD